MQSTNLPSKYLVPFAKNDGAKVELPVTTATAGRASQSLGFPPITGQPPEAGGLPPQLEDFNGAMNQPARIAWWSQLGGKFPFDNTFATDTNINGYPNGAELLSSDNTGTWLSLADNNVSNPDTGAGTTWVPARAYGAFALTGQTGGTVTPTPVQAMKRRITIAGTLTSNLIVILPNWLYSWDVTNNTSGAFTVTVKTAAGSGVVIPQNGAPTPIVGDSTNIVQPASNIPLATSATQAAQFSQTSGRLINVQVFKVSGTYTPTAGTTSIEVEGVGGGGAGGGVANPGAAASGSAGGGGGGAWGKKRITAGITSQTVTIGAGGTGVVAGAGNAGTATSFGSLLILPGGGAGILATTLAAAGVSGTYGGGGLAPTGADYGTSGNHGQAGILLSQFGTLTGAGGSSPYGAGGGQAGSTSASQGRGPDATGFGSGGSGAWASQSTAGQAGGAGTPGILIIREYA